MAVSLPSCAADPLHGVTCWGDGGTPPTYVGAPLALNVSPLAADATGATCDSVPVAPRVRYTFAAAAGVALMTCPAMADLQTSWWGGTLETLHETPLLPLGAPVSWVLSGGEMERVQGLAVHVIATVYEPVAEIAVAHVCMQRIAVDSSPPEAGALACPLASDTTALAIMASDGVPSSIAPPCYSTGPLLNAEYADAGGALRHDGVTYAPNTSVVAMLLTRSFSDPQSDIGSVSGIAALRVRAVAAAAAPSSALPLTTNSSSMAPAASDAAGSTSIASLMPYADATVYCDDPTCGASLVAREQWSVLGDFGAAAAAASSSSSSSSSPVRFGSGAVRISDEAMLSPAGWMATTLTRPPYPPPPPSPPVGSSMQVPGPGDGTAAAAPSSLTWHEGSVEVVAGSIGGALSIALPAGTVDLAVAAAVGNASVCAVRLASEHATGGVDEQMLGVPLASSSSTSPFTVVSIRRHVVLPTAIPTSAGNGSSSSGNGSREGGSGNGGQCFPPPLLLAAAFFSSTRAKSARGSRKLAARRHFFLLAASSSGAARSGWKQLHRMVAADQAARRCVARRGGGFPLGFAAGRAGYMRARRT